MGGGNGNSNQRTLDGGREQGSNKLILLCCGTHELNTADAAGSKLCCWKESEPKHVVKGGLSTKGRDGNPVFCFGPT